VPVLVDGGYVWDPTDACRRELVGREKARASAQNLRQVIKAPRRRWLEITVRIAAFVAVLPAFLMGAWWSIPLFAAFSHFFFSNPLYLVLQVFGLRGQEEENGTSTRPRHRYDLTPLVPMHSGVDAFTPSNVFERTACYHSWAWLIAVNVFHDVWYMCAARCQGPAARTFLD
jgi:hypothetical protein